MKKYISALIFTLTCAIATATSVTFITPQNGDQVGKVWTIEGTASPTSGSITSVSYTITGGTSCTGYTGCSGSVYGGSSWFQTLYFVAGSIPSGSHTLTVTAVDSAMNSGSTSITINVIYSNPICSGTTIGSGFSCIKTTRSLSASYSGFTATASADPMMGSPNYTAGDTLVVHGEVHAPGLPNTTLGADITTTTPGSITLTQPPVYTATATTVNGSNVITLTSPTTPTDVCAGRWGEQITGSGIPTGTKIMGCPVDNTHLFLSNYATANASGVTVTLSYAFPAPPFNLWITDAPNQVLGTNYEQVTISALGPPIGGLMLGTMSARGQAGTTAVTHVASGGRAGAYAPVSNICEADISNTLGYTFHTILSSNTSFTDEGAVPIFLCYATVPSTTSVSDTITFTDSYFIPSGSLPDEIFITVAQYRGLGTIGNTNSPISGWGGMDGTALGCTSGLSCANGSMAAQGAGNGGLLSAWNVTAGDLCIDVAVGTPFQIINGGITLIPSTPAVNPSGTSPLAWNERVEDNQRPWSMMMDAVATNSHCNGGAISGPGDGVSNLAVAFHPSSGPTPVNGQSALLSASTYLTSASIPAVNTTTGTRSIDFEFDNVASAGADTFIASADLGVTFQLNHAGGHTNITTTVLPFNSWAGTGTCGGNGYSVAVDNVASVGSNYPVYGRYNADFTRTPRRDSFEIWDGTGTRIYASFCDWNGLSGSISTGPVVLGGGMAGSDTVQIGFIWERSTVLPMNSKMPTFGRANTNCIYDWHLDTSTGNTADSCSFGPYNLTATGSVTYPDTASAVQSLVKAIPTQYGAVSTSVSGWAAMKSTIGTQQMDCLAQSVTQYNASDLLSCAWTQTQGPTVTFNNANSTSPTISGIVATNISSLSDYILSVTVSDTQATPGTATGTIEMGAVPQDTNGVVTNITGNTLAFFGPLMSYGNIPWGEIDTNQFIGIGAQQTFQNNQPYRQWGTPGSGTISYPFTGVGQGFGIPGTYLTGSGITSATATSFTINDASVLSLATLPTWIMVGDFHYGPFELIRICNTTATSGPAMLTVCYDGRGLSGNSSADFNPSAATSWPANTTVGELAIKGTGTHFQSDASRPLAPSGVPGPIGLPVSTTGRVTVTSGSGTLLGIGTSWTGAIVGQTVFVSVLTHNGGTAFNFWRQITGYTDATHVTLDHAAPASIDNGTSVAYYLYASLYPSLEFGAAQDNHTVRILQTVYGCESDTACFGRGQHDIPQIDSVTQSGYHYSYQTQLGMAGSFNPNFYGHDLGAWNFFLRSGYTPALTLARYISNYWVSSPELAEGYAQSGTFNIGGGVHGAMASFLVDAATPLSSATFEQYALSYTFQYLLKASDMTPQLCNTADTRDTGIMGSFVAHSANWDANTGTGTLSGSIGTNSTGGTITGWTGAQTPPFVALLEDGTTYEFVRVTGIAGSTFTWTANYYVTGGGTYTHTSGSQLLTGAAMYTFILSKLDVRDQGCRRNASDMYSGVEVNSWANSGYFPPTSSLNAANAYGPLTMTATSTAVTSTGSILPAMCNGKETGTLSIANGGTVATLLGSSVVGNGPAPWERIYIWDQVSYLGAFAYIADSYGITGAHVTLAGTWLGANCTSGSPCTYMTSNAGSFLAIWYENNDTYADNEALKKSWECVYNSSTSITLNRPWDGPSTITGTPLFWADVYTVMGFPQQPFLLSGYKTTGMRWAQHSTNSTVAAHYLTMAQQAGTWSRTYGWDHIDSGGMYYTAVQDICPPTQTLPFNYALVANAYISTIHGGDSGNPGCGAVGSNIANSVARVNNGEGGQGMAQWAAINPVANNPYVDIFIGKTYGAQQPYGANGGCSISVASTCDGIDALNCEASNMGDYKWFAFCFGEGGFFATSYPAQRTLSTPTFGPVPIFWSGQIRGRFLVDPSHHTWLVW